MNTQTTPKFIGYCEMDSIPVKPGQYVTIPKGTLVKHRGVTKPAGRKLRVLVDHILPGQNRPEGDKYHTPDIAVIPPKVRWAGSGGYWSEVDINSVPEAMI